ncbi:hypothetical protein N8T08_009563 [Aspergillus melleus]|uniref:Uncharacterized protein n=1 Tax=Aspergillus melleus TaxID=138277 RepID=A0ACC3BDW6_9EURO|nr:hypothetical protein N8T08_009563 [Aspergillus melleus]
MDPSTLTLPPMKDLTVENITENAIRMNSLCEDERMKYVLERLVTHLHDFARETRLSTDEWMKGLLFLTEVGKICSDVRQEFILLSDILGLSILVDSIDHPKPPTATEGTVLGPFHTHEATELPPGTSISSDPHGQPLLVVCTVKDTSGNPLPNIKVDVWETDSTGHYDVQYEGRDGPDGRCLVRSDEQGVFWFKAITPVPALYLRNDPYETSDAVFGVKDSLVVDIGRAGPEYANRYNVPEDHALLTYDFVLVSEAETRELRERNSKLALDKLGRKVRMVGGLPVPDLD